MLGINRCNISIQRCSFILENQEKWSPNMQRLYTYLAQTNNCMHGSLHNQIILWGWFSDICIHHRRMSRILPCVDLKFTWFHVIPCMLPYWKTSVTAVYNVNMIWMSIHQQILLDRGWFWRARRASQNTPWKVISAGEWTWILYLFYYVFHMQNNAVFLGKIKLKSRPFCANTAKSVLLL